MRITVVDRRLNDINGVVTLLDLEVMDVSDYEVVMINEVVE